MSRDVSRSQIRQSTSVLASIATAVFVAAALYWARAILIPISLAILITFVLTPLVLVLQRRGIGRVPSVALVMVASLAVIGAVGIIVGEQIVQLTKTLPDHADQIKAKVIEVKKMISPNEGSRFSELINELSQTLEPSTTSGAQSEIVVSQSPSWAARFETYFTPAAEVLGEAAFTLILVVFMLLRREDLRNRAIRLLGQGRVTTTTKAVDETARRISRFLLAQFLLNSAFGLVITLGLVIIGVAYAPLWGFIAFLMRYVPYIGTWIAVIPPALFTFAVDEGWGPMIGVLALFLGLEALCSNFLEPVLYGPRLGLSEVAQLVATAFWALLWGPVGIILAWPLTTCMLMLGKYVPQLRFLNVLLGDEPVLTPRVALYQRLTARDQDEAAEIVDKELASRPTDEVLNDLLIPALSQARKDLESGLLTDEDLGFVVHAIEEIADDFDQPDAPAADAGPPVPVLLIPAKDEIDRVAGALFAKILQPAFWNVELAPAERLTSEVVSRIEALQPAIAVIVSVAPGGVTNMRYLCKRLHSKFKDLKIIVGRWADTDEGSDRIVSAMRKTGAEEVAMTFDETKRFLLGWRTVFAAGTVAPSTTTDRGPAAKPEIGTLTA